MADHSPNLLKTDHQQNFPSLSQHFRFECFELLSNSFEGEELNYKPLEKHYLQRQGLPLSPKITTSVASSTHTHPLYRGIRSRNGKWVSEIRVPRTKTRIWLGTYPTPEMAAAAYDAASLVLKGPDTALNFPTHKYNNLLLLPKECFTAAGIRMLANAAASQAVASESLALPAPQLAPQCSNNYVSSYSTNFLETKQEYVDEEELFDMPNLLMAMAEGMLITPPIINISTPPSDDSGEESLWSYRL